MQESTQNHIPNFSVHCDLIDYNKWGNKDIDSEQMAKYFLALQFMSLETMLKIGVEIAESVPVRVGIDLNDACAGSKNKFGLRCPLQCITCKGADLDQTALKSGLIIQECNGLISLSKHIDLLLKNGFHVQEFVITGLPGEPFLYQKSGLLAQVIRLIRVKSDIPIRINTSGVIPVLENDLRQLKTLGVNSIAISLNALSEESHQLFTQTAAPMFSSAINFINRAIQVFGEDQVIISFLGLAGMENLAPDRLTLKEWQSLKITRSQVIQFINQHWPDQPPRYLFRTALSIKNTVGIFGLPTHDLGISPIEADREKLHQQFKSMIY